MVICLLKGMGSSSSFVVGCNNILSNLCGKSFTKKLANESLKFEQDILRKLLVHRIKLQQHMEDLIRLNFLRVEV